MAYEDESSKLVLGRLSERLYKQVQTGKVTKEEAAGLMLWLGFYLMRIRATDDKVDRAFEMIDALMFELENGHG